MITTHPHILTLAQAREVPKTFSANAFFDLENAMRHALHRKYGNGWVPQANEDELAAVAYLADAAEAKIA